MDAAMEILLQEFAAERIDAIEGAALKQESIAKLRAEYVEALDLAGRKADLDALSYASVDFHAAMYRQIYWCGIQDGLRLLKHMMALPLPEVSRP